MRSVKPGGLRGVMEIKKMEKDISERPSGKKTLDSIYFQLQTEHVSVPTCCHVSMLKILKKYSVKN